MNRTLRRAFPLTLSALLAACAGLPPQGSQVPAAPLPASTTTVPPAAATTSGVAEPAPAQDIWDKLRRSFAMSDCNADPAVVGWAKRYTREPKQFEGQLRSALPRLAFVQQVAAQYNVAGEFVLLPWVESHYRPIPARKRSPAGIWQIMPVTAGAMGLRVDRHYDARLDMPAAAHAVMKLLEQYHDQFHDWRVVDYAYNSGEFRVRKLVREHGLPAAEPVIPAWPASRIAHEHLVKLLAIACVVREPARFQVSLPVPSEAEHLVQTSVTASIPMAQAASQAGMSVDALKHLNPAFSGDTIEVGAASYLMLPASHAEQFRLDSHGAPNEVIPTGSTRIASLDGKAAAPRHHHQTHVVSPGESLWQIAREYSTNVSRLQQLNHLHDDAIRPGQVLQLDDVD